MRPLRASAIAVVEKLKDADAMASAVSARGDDSVVTSLERVRVTLQTALSSASEAANSIADLSLAAEMFWIVLGSLLLAMGYQLSTSSPVRRRFSHTVKRRGYLSYGARGYYTCATGSVAADCVAAHGAWSRKRARGSSSSRAVQSRF
jgi:hypothetical protein